MHDFAKFEILIFIAQVLGSFLYLLQSQIHLRARQKSESIRDDPYFKVLQSKSSDFMVAKNLIQETSSLLWTTIVICGMSG